MGIHMPATPADDAHTWDAAPRAGAGSNRLSTAEPDFSKARATGENDTVLGARDLETASWRGRLTAEREVYVNGTPTRLGYLGQLRIDRRYRGRWLVARGFSMLKQLHDRDPLPGYLAAVTVDNREAEGILVSKARKRFPAFHLVASYCTLALPVGRGAGYVCVGHGRRHHRDCPLSPNERLAPSVLPGVERSEADLVDDASRSVPRGRSDRATERAHRRADRFVGPVGVQAGRRALLFRLDQAGRSALQRGAPGSAASTQDRREDSPRLRRIICTNRRPSGSASWVATCTARVAAGRRDDGLDERDQLFRTARERSHIPYRTAVYCEWRRGTPSPN